MSRSINVDQFVGATFTSMIQKDQFEIELTTLTHLEKEIDRSLRNLHDTVLHYSLKDILIMLETYSDFFSFHHDVIKIQEQISRSISHNNEIKANYIRMFQTYFTSGIPNNVYDTLVKTIDVFLEKEIYDGEDN